MLLINLTRHFQKIIIATLLIIAVIPSTAKAGETDIVLFTGLRGGGEFEDLDTGDELKLKETQTFGIVIDKQMKNGKYYEFYYSHQPSELTSSDPSTGSLFDVDIDYLHFGGKHYINKEDGTFIVGTIGATHFNPKAAGLSDETKFSLGLGGGIEFMGTKNIGLRLEGRAFGNFLDSSGAIFCGGSSGGCTIITTSSVLWQLELNVGLIIRF
jgi:hypothetical protein